MSSRQEQPMTHALARTPEFDVGADARGAYDSGSEAAMPDIDVAFSDAVGPYEIGFKDAVESFIAAGVDAATVTTVLDSYGNNAGDETASLPQHVLALMDQAATALRAALPFLGQLELGPASRYTPSQAAGRQARDVIARLERSLADAPSGASAATRAPGLWSVASLPTLGERRYSRIVAGQGIVAECEEGPYAAGDGVENARWIVACSNKLRGWSVELLEDPDFAVSLVHRPAPVSQPGLFSVPT